jgi:hypothetical protein
MRCSFILEVAEESVLDWYYPVKKVALVICSLIMLPFAWVLRLVMLLVAIRPKWRCEILGIFGGLSLPSWLFFSSKDFAKSTNNTADQLRLGINIGHPEAVCLLVAFLKWRSSLCRHRPAQETINQGRNGARTARHSPGTLHGVAL